MDRVVLLRGALSWRQRPQEYIQNVIDSIRTWHKGELIISTWKSEEARSRILIGVDSILYNHDPGPGPVQNFNRQLANFYYGLKNISRKSEVLVLRTDTMCFRDLFSIRGRYPRRISENLTVFNQKVLISNMMTIRPGSDEKINTLRIGDWVHCGVYDDIEKIANVFEDISYLDREIISSLEVKGEICTEKLWSLMILKKYFSRKISEYESVHIDNWSWDCILNNFEVIDQYSTAYCVNLNYSFQPQRLDCYLKEKEYVEKYQSLSSNIKNP